MPLFILKRIKGKKMEFKPELLSPAGSLKVLKAAANVGADAVYFGFNSFNARYGAKNFSLSDAEAGLSYLHNRGKKGYITLNTLIKDSEIKDFIVEIENAVKIGADGVIVQDIGAISLIKDVAPNLEIHGSTQMTVHNLEGVNFLYNNGIKRIVLSRELSLDEIKHIKKNTDCEIEIFIHGALCVCYSGQCYMSSFIGDRSGNRGKCAQPCRLNYEFMGKKGTLLSIKDLNSINYIDTFLKLKIDSLKIEGRLKNEYYVAVVVDGYRRLLDGEKLSKEDIDLMNNIFYRGGYTDYFNDYKNKKMFCYNKNENPYSHYETKAEEKFKDIINKNISDNQAKIPLNMEISLYKNAYPTLYGYAMGKETYVVGEEILGEAKNAPATYEKVKESLVKLNDTPFYLNDLKGDIEDGVFIPLKSVNELRRNLCEKLMEKEDKVINTVQIKNKKRQERNLKFIVKANLQSQLTWADSKEEIEFVFANYNLLLKNKDFIDKEKMVITLPKIISENEMDKVKSRLKKLKEAGFKYGLVSNISHFELLKEFKLITDIYLNITNSYSKDFLVKNNVFMVGASSEITLKDISYFMPDMPVFAMGYGYIESMTLRNCIKRSVLNECVKGPQTLVDRKGEKFIIDCREDCRNVILNPHPIVMSDKMNDLKMSGIDYVLLSFYSENMKRCEEVLNMYKSNDNLFEKFTRGHFYRGAL